MENFRRNFQRAFLRLRRRRPKPVWLLVLTHIVALGLALCVFALPHHVVPEERKSLGVMSVRASTAPIAAEPTLAPETAVSQETDPSPVKKEATQITSAVLVGDFSNKFPGKFIDGDPVVTENSYVSQNVNISIESHCIEGEENGKKGISFFVADVYIRDISCFQTTFAQDKFGKGITDSMEESAERTDAVLIMNGDFYGTHAGGVCIRNGQLYSLGEIVRDIGVLFWDGRFEWYRCDEFNYQQALQEGAYQAWNFGPALLDENGAVRSDVDKFYKDIAYNHPRSAFGYYEPGHYCFIVVDGRSDISRGVSLPQLGKIAETLGLTQCYNLDGGQTAVLGFMKKLVNQPGTGSRDCSDYLCIVDRVTE